MKTKSLGVFLSLVLSFNLNATPASPSTSCTPAPSGLVSWWPGENNAQDIAGTNNGTLVGGVSYAAGEVNQAFSLDGASGCVSVPDSPLIHSFTNRMTVELWMKAGQTNANADWKGLVTKGNSSWRLMAASGAETVYWDMDGVSPSDLSGTRNVNDGQWHHVAATYDGTNMCLYVDGTLDVSKAATGLITQNNEPVCIGANSKAYVPSCHCNQLGYFFNGSMDEVSLYNRALSASEIQAIYAAGSGGKCSSPVAPTIASQPTNQTVAVGGTANFSVTTAGSLPLSYQWSFKGTNLSGATNTSLTLTNVQLTQAGNYAVMVTNLYGSILSSNASLTVLALPPDISIQPVNQTASVGGSATFSVTASGAVPLGYFWRRNGTPIVGANISSYTTNNVQLADSGSQFSCLVSNAYGTALSSNAVLTVSLQPTHYVSLNSIHPVVPYLSWATAATNIQDAIDVATNSDLVLVSNGVYATGGRIAGAFVRYATNRVAVTNAVTVRSVNGPALTIIQGQSMLIRCAYLINGAVLSGFTLTNGYGGVCCESTSAVITNSVIINCFNDFGGGAWSSTLNNCTLTGNTAYTYGGGAYICTLNNCLLTGNSVPYNGNTCLYDSRGGGAFNCTLNNCILTGNSAGAGGGSYSSTLNNCTLVGNYAFSFHCGDVQIIDGVGGGACNSTLNNCIIYYNNSDQSSPNVNVASTLNYCCTTPMPASGVGNMTFAPRFVDQAGGNLRLQSNSPCINAGNNSYVTGSTDLDGNPRIFGGTVDMGAYEFQGTGNVGFVAWLQQYGLAADGSADYADPDGDGLNNWQEWYAGTVPTNAASVLKMVAASNTVSGVTVSWQSVTNRSYFLQRSTNLGVTPAFSTIQSNIAGQAGTTSYMDTTAANGSPYFYRVGVQLAP